MAAIRDPTAHALLARVQRVVLSHPRLGPINTAFVGPRQPDPSRPQVLLLHGFDSSCLEFRRLLPLLEGHVDVYAMDAVGCGFTGSSGLPLLHPTTLGEQCRGTTPRLLLSEEPSRLSTEVASAEECLSRTLAV